MAKESPNVMLLIPAYNEEARIGPVLRDYAGYFRENYEGEFLIVVVLNGCRDNTLGVVEEAAREFPEIEALNFQEPIGKGGALIDGFKKAADARAVLTGYVDADGATTGFEIDYVLRDKSLQRLTHFGIGFMGGRNSAMGLGPYILARTGIYNVPHGWDLTLHGGLTTMAPFAEGPSGRTRWPSGWRRSRSAWGSSWCTTRPGR